MDYAKYIEQKKLQYTKPKYRIVKPKLNYELSDTGAAKDDRSSVNKSSLFRTKLQPLDAHDTSVAKSVMSNDELVKLSVERSIHAPLFMHQEAPTRDGANPARFKSSVMKVKIPVSHEKFKAHVTPAQPEILDLQPQDTKSFYKNRPLHEFDCYDDDKTPEEWLKVCGDMNSIAHAHTLIYENYEYFWKPCQVLGYNTESHRFNVKVMHTGVKKEVVRLSLRFISEDAEVFKKRIELCKYLRNHAESEYRLKNYIELIPQEKVTSMSKPLKARIFNKVVESLPSLEITEHVDYFVRLKRELEQSYVDSQKKFLVETEMKNPNNHWKYESQNIIVKNPQEFIPDFGIIRLKKPQDQDEAALLRLDDPLRTDIEKKVATLCSEYLDEELLKLDYNKVTTPLTIDEFNNVLKDNYHKILYRLTQNWRYKINEELKKFYFEKNSKRNEAYFRMTREDEDLIEAHIIKINFYLNNQLRTYMKYLLDSGVQFYCQYSNTRHIQYSSNLSINQMIEDRWLQRHDEFRLNDHLEVFRVYKRIEELRTPLITINLVSCESNENLIESKIVKYMRYQPDLLTIRKSLMAYVDHIKQLSEVIDKIDSNELKLRDSVRERLLTLFESEEDYLNMRTYPWFSSAYVKVAEIIESCIDGLIENILKYKEFDDIMNIKELDTYNFFKNFREMIKLAVKPEETTTEEQQNKVLIAHRAKHSQQNALVESRQSPETADSNKIKRKRSKSDLEKEKRDNDKLFWRDDNCENPSSMYLKTEIEKYKNYVARLKQINSVVIDRNMFRIDITELQDKIQTKCQGIIDEIHKYVHETTDKELSEVADSLQEVYEKLKNVPEEENKLRELEDYLENKFANEMLMLEARYDNSKELLTVLEDTGYDYSKETQKKQFSIQGKQCLINNQLSICRRNRIVNKERLSKKLEDEIVAFETKFKKLRDNIESTKVKNNYSSYQTLSMKVQEYSEDLQRNIKESYVLEDRCKFLEFDQRMPPTRDIEKTRDEFTPYCDLWLYISEYHKFYTDCLEIQELKGLQKEGMEGKFRDMMAKSQKIRTHFLSLSEETGEELPIQEVTEKFFLDLNQFHDKLLPLIIYLGNEAIEKEHWDDIIRLTEITVEKGTSPTKGTTTDSYPTILKQITGIDVMKFKVELEEISSKAFKQHKIKKDMERIESQLKERELHIVPYNTTFLIQEVESISQDLDDKVQSLQQMKNSPDINQKLKADCAQIGSKIERFSRVLGLWTRFQNSWIYLEPIFGNEDIKEQLKVEANKFEQWNRQWVERMRESNMDKKVSTHIESENLEELFSLGNETLDEIFKGMTLYLNKKRATFARFFFLTDLTLIEIISRTKFPELIQGYISKLFENMASLNFNEGRIVSFNSQEGEKVKLNKFIAVDEGEFRGSVEKWLKELELRAKKSLKELNLECLNDITKKNPPYRQWLASWPFMCCFTIEYYKWCNECEAAITKIPQDKDSFKRYYDGMVDDFDYFTEFARSDSLEHHERTKVLSILTMKVNFKNVAEFIQNNNVNDTENFYWKAQLKYYYDFSKETNIKCSLLDFNINYDFEYQGPNTRLVITPASNRCFRSLVTAKCLNYSNSIEGPSGVGKTETVKDLAKALGMQCMLFGSSLFMTEETLSKMFKGIAGTGAWAIFEEFDRLTKETLSVISMMLFELVEAIRGKKTTIVFQGYEGTRVLDSMCVNLTMNPHRVRGDMLPDNLRYQVRPCVLKMPDYQIIARTQLFILGFNDSAPIATKMCNVFEYARKVLSGNRQNDFGLRMLLQVVRWTSDIRMKVKMSESVSCLKALNDCLLPRLSETDTLGFKDILKDMFSGESFPETQMYDINMAMSAALEKHQLIENTDMLEKVYQLHDLQMHHRAIIVLGEANIGKSTLIKVYKDTMEHESNPDRQNVTVRYVNPRAVDSQWVYGHYEPHTEQYQMGVIPKTCSALMNEPVNDLKWLVLDGQVDPSYSEDLSSLLDDNLKLTLFSGDYIKVNPQLKVFFEAENLEKCSPNLVSRAGIILLDSLSFTFNNLIKYYNKELIKFAEENAFMKLDLEKWKTICETISYMIIPIVHWKYKSYSLLSNKYVMISHFYRLFKMIITDMNTALIAKGTATVDKGKLEGDFRTATLFAVVWSFGAEMDIEQRAAMNNFLNELMRGKANVNEKYKLSIEKEWSFEPNVTIKFNTMDDYFTSYFDAADGKTHPFESRQFGSLPEISIMQMYIPTKETFFLNWYLQLCQRHRQHVLTVATTGYGKTRIMTNEVKSLSNMSEVKEGYVYIDFHKFIKASQLQFRFENKIGQRVGNKTYAPSEGAWGNILIDDLHLCKPDSYGVQQPIELLRQWLDYGGWYDNKSPELAFKFFTNISLIATSNPNALPLRQTRHFHTLLLNSLDKEATTKLYTTHLDNILTQANYNSEVCLLKAATVEGASRVVEEIRNMLKPKPLTPHYTFTTREVFSLINCIGLSNKAAVYDDLTFTKLFVHETTRVIKDKLQLADHDVFDRIMNETLLKLFNSELEKINSKDGLHFGSFMSTKTEEGIMEYNELYDKEKIKQFCNEQIRKFNEEKPSNHLDIVLFDYVISKICIVSRLLRIEGGHGILVGKQGLGKHSVIELSSFICNETIIDVAIPDEADYEQRWHGLLQYILFTAGFKENVMVKISLDNIKSSEILDNIVNVLSSSEVSGLFDKLPVKVTDSPSKMEYKKEDIINKVSEIPENKHLLPSELWDKFKTSIHKNLHIMIVEHDDERFRHLVRDYPVIQTKSQVVYWFDWPENSYSEIAESKLKEMELDRAKRNSIVNICKNIHFSAVDLSSRVYNETKFKSYITAKNFLDLIAYYIIKYKKIREMVENNLEMYDSGIKNLEKVEYEVVQLEQKNTELTPQLEQIRTLVNSEKEKIDQAQEELQVKENKVNEKNSAVEKIKKEIDNDKSNIEIELQKVDPVVKDTLAKVRKTEDKAFTDLFNSSSPNQKMNDLLEIFLEVYKVKNPRINYEMDDKVERGVRIRVKSVYKTCKMLAKQVKFKDEILEFNFADLKYSPDIFEQVTPKFKEVIKEDMARISPALLSIYDFMYAAITYFEVDHELEKSRRTVKDKEDEMDKLTFDLNDLQKYYEKHKEGVEVLKQSVEQKETKMKELEHDLDLYTNRLERASRLTEGLKLDKNTWITYSKTFDQRKTNLEGDVLIYCALMAYLSPFTKPYRDSELEGWRRILKDQKWEISQTIKLKNILEDTTVVNGWMRSELPQDDFSLDNAVIMMKSDRYTLAIDPNMQASNFLRRKIELVDNKKPVRLASSVINYEQESKNFKLALRHGTCVVMENFQEPVHPLVKPLLFGNSFKRKDATYVNIDGEDLEVHKEFQLYLINPNHRPEFSLKVWLNLRLINFSATTNGLFELLRTKCIEFSGEKKVFDHYVNYEKDVSDQQLIKQKYELQILHELSNKEVELLDNQNLLLSLEESEKSQNTIRKYEQSAKATKKRFEELKKIFDKIAEKVAHLFFVLDSLWVLNPMYVYSLDWYRELFVSNVKKLNKDKDKIETEFKESLYDSVSTGMLEKDRPVLSLLICLKMMELDRLVEPNLAKFLITGGEKNDSESEYPDLASKTKWCTREVWSRLEEISNKLESHSGFHAKFSLSITTYDEIFEDPKCIHKTFPGISDMQDKKEKKNIKELREMLNKLLIIRICRPDYFKYSATVVVQKFFDHGGDNSKVVEHMPYNLKSVFSLSKPHIPVVFIMGPGTDPMSEFVKFSKEYNNLSDENVLKKSLGKDQVYACENAILKAREKGQWVIFQNCHLSKDFMNTLELRLAETISLVKANENKKKKKEDEEEDEEEEQKIRIDPKFRIWATSAPTADFPPFIAMNSIKVACETPKSLKANMVRNYNLVEKNFFNEWEEDKMSIIKKSIYAIALFHGVLYQRSLYGRVGYCRDYKFSNSDFEMMKEMTRHMISNYPEPPIANLCTVISEVIYGGKMSDESDLLLVRTLIDDYINMNFLTDVNYKCNAYTVPDLYSLEDWRNYIQTLDTSVELASLSGLDKSCDKVITVKASREFISNIKVLHQSHSLDVEDHSDRVEYTCNKYLHQLPEEFNTFDLNNLKPLAFDNALNFVLHLDVQSYNTLLRRIREDLGVVKKAILGLEPFEEEVSVLYHQVLNNQIPPAWEETTGIKSSASTLSCLFADLQKRLNAIKRWIYEQQPIVFWLPMFANPRAFLAALLQNFSRQTKTPIDNYDLRYVFTDNEPTDRASKGEWVNGLMIDQARLNAATFELEDCDPGLTLTSMPWIQIVPTSKSIPRPLNCYECPLYKSYDKFGILQASGQTSNFIENISLPIPTESKYSHIYYMRKGVALYLDSSDTHTMD